MTKARKIIYWISTAWLALGMVSTGIFQLFQVKEEIEFILDLGYPAYFLSILGLWKLLGAVAVLIPGMPLLKEWTYAGFFFAMSGAVYSHVASGNAMGISPALLLLALTAISWYFRPTGRKIAVVSR